jgi:D-sedoheptulose 7-phosphate isomerase
MMADHPVLQGLYPFLHGPRGAGALDAALSASLRQKVAHHREVIDAFFAEHGPAVIAAAGAIAGVYRRDGRLYTIGNGGSRCDAAHLAVEFLHPVTTGRPALTAIDLSADATMLTAVGNDVGFAHVFSRQVTALCRAGDGLVGISTSGTSENLVLAFARAKELGVVTIALTGKTGGALAALDLDHCLVVETDSIHRIQECHVVIYHLLWDLVHTLLADDRGALAVPAKGPP